MSTNHQVYLSLVYGDFGMEILMEANGPDGIPMPDNTTDVYPGDTVEWLLGEDSGIVSINNIYPTEDVLFSGVAQSQTGTDIWTADINTDVAPRTKPYTYHIDVTPLPTDIDTLADSTSLKTKVGLLTFDPKIKVKPHA